MSNRQWNPIRSPKFYLSVIVPVLLLVLLIFTVGWQLGPGSAQTTEVGAASPGLNLYEFVGRVDQVGGDFTGYGYLSYIRGLDNNQLFTNPLQPGEATARFTFFTTITLTSRAVISSVFAIDSAGATTFYFNPAAGASFHDPQSFTKGSKIVTADVRYQNVLNVQAPNLGIATGVGELVQHSAAAFTLGGQSYQLGHTGMIQRIATTGEGTRTDAVKPVSFVVLSGNAVDTGQRQTFLPNVLGVTLR